MKIPNKSEIPTQGYVLPLTVDKDCIALKHPFPLQSNKVWELILQRTITTQNHAKT
jgi:hypothetical protein